MTEDWQFARRRQRLVEQLAEKGISSREVLAAFGRVPRHLFVEDAFRERAYYDEALPIGSGQTISQPFTVAYQTMLLDVRPDDRILEIGTGSGYQAAILCEMGARVFTIERLEELYDRTAPLLRDLGYRAVCRLGDGTQGWESMAPFDGIIVTAGAGDVPEQLTSQLRIESESHRAGRLVIPVGDRNTQYMVLIRRLGETEFDREIREGFRFVPLIPDS